MNSEKMHKAPGTGSPDVTLDPDHDHDSQQKESPTSSPASSLMVANEERKQSDENAILSAFNGSNSTLSHGEKTGLPSLGESTSAFSYASSTASFSSLFGSQNNLMAAADLEALPDTNKDQTGPSNPTVSEAVNETCTDGDAKLPARPRQDNMGEEGNISKENSQARNAPSLEAINGTETNTLDLPTKEQEDSQNPPAETATPMADRQPAAVTSSGTVPRNSTSASRAQRLARKREQMQELGCLASSRSPPRAMSYTSAASQVSVARTRYSLPGDDLVVSITSSRAGPPAVPTPISSFPGDDLAALAAASSSRATPSPLVSTQITETTAIADPLALPPTPAGPLPTGHTRSKGDGTIRTAPNHPQQPGTTDLQSTNGTEASPGAFQERVRAVGDIPVWALQINTAATTRPPAQHPTCIEPPGLGINPNPTAAGEVCTSLDAPSRETSGANILDILSNNNANGLVEARRISDSNLQAELTQAEEVNPAEEERKSIAFKRQQNWFLSGYFGCAILVICSVVLALTLGFTLGKKDKEANMALPSLSPTMCMESHVLSLLPEYTQQSIDEDANTPQAKAYSWIMADPNLITYSDERIIQRIALGILYYATHGEEWRDNASWMSYQVHECEWHAQDTVKILTNMYKFSDQPMPVPLDNAMSQYLNTSFPCEDPIREKLYSHLWLLANDLQGSLPPELNLLTSLKTIVLALNSLTGPGLSTEVGKLSSLEAVVFLSNELSGTLPTEIGLSSSLQILILRDNKMSGTVPTELGLLSDTMKMLDLPYNEITGTIPQSLASLVEMNFLSLYDNELTGTIPTVLGVLPKTQWLDLGKNQLLGTIPSELGLLENLEAAWLCENSLTGTVPWEFAKLVTTGSLELFHINNNNLTGTLLNDLCLIETLSDYNNELIGCNCSCYFESSWYPGQEMCAPLPDLCT